MKKSKSITPSPSGSLKGMNSSMNQSFADGRDSKKGPKSIAPLDT